MCDVFCAPAHGRSDFGSCFGVLITYMVTYLTFYGHIFYCLLLVCLFHLLQTLVRVLFPVFPSPILRLVVTLPKNRIPIPYPRPFRLSHTISSACPERDPGPGMSTRLSRAFLKAFVETSSRRCHKRNWLEGGCGKKFVRDVNFVAIRIVMPFFRRAVLGSIFGEYSDSLKTSKVVKNILFSLRNEFCSAQPWKFTEKHQTFSKPAR